MNRCVGVVEGKGSELDKFNHNGEGQMNEQNKRTLVERRSFAEVVFARETPLERKERAYRCPHEDITTLCLTCAGLSVSDVNRWNLLRTIERHIRSHGPSVDPNIRVRISGNDCVLIPRSENTVAATQISDWYECDDCYRTSEVPANKSLSKCPRCGGPVHPIAEPFQRTNFSPYIGNGAKEENYAGTYTESRKMESIAVRDLYTDPNSRFQKGGTGFLRIPLDAPRETRAESPDWLPVRGRFIETLRHTRSQRAERILRGFYLNGKTDKELAKSECWAADSIKKERRDLVRRGTDYFRIAAARHPPSPAMGERRAVARPTLGGVSGSPLRAQCTMAVYRKKERRD